MGETITARKRLRWLLGLLVAWDLILGLYAVFFAGHFQELVRFVPRPEPLFIRGVGLYWLFAAYFQFLGARDPVRFVTAVQLSIVFRVSAGLLDSVEALVLLGQPWYFFHYLLLFFVVMNFAIAYATGRWLQGMGLKWIDV